MVRLVNLPNLYFIEFIKRKANSKKQRKQIINRNEYAVFIDTEKVLDSVPRKITWSNLENGGVNRKLQERVNNFKCEQ